MTEGMTQCYRTRESEPTTQHSSETRYGVTGHELVSVGNSKPHLPDCQGPEDRDISGANRRGSPRGEGVVPDSILTCRR